MTLLKVRECSEITLPRDIRDALNVQEGDYLEAEVVEGGVPLKPVPAAAREEAWRKIRQAMATVRYVGPQPEPSEDEVMEEAVRLVKEVRKEMARERREGRSR